MAFIFLKCLWVHGWMLIFVFGIPHSCLWTQFWSTQPADRGAGRLQWAVLGVHPEYVFWVGGSTSCLSVTHHLRFHTPSLVHRGQKPLPPTAWCRLEKRLLWVFPPSSPPAGGSGGLASRMPSRQPWSTPEPCLPHARWFLDLLGLLLVFCARMACWVWYIYMYTTFKDLGQEVVATTRAKPAVWILSPSISLASLRCTICRRNWVMVSRMWTLQSEGAGFKYWSLCTPVLVCNTEMVRICLQNA